MPRSPVPPDAAILVELGSERPREVAFEPFGPFEVLWVITNGTLQRNFLWVCARKTGIYVAFGGPDHVHTSYHVDGEFHWKVGKDTIDLGRKPPLPEIAEPILIQSATTVITEEALRAFDLASFDDRSVDRVVYLDSRKLPEAVYYQVWVVPPFRHGRVPLKTEWPAHVHLVTHTNPWLQLVIYEQGDRTAGGGAA